MAKRGNKYYIKKEVTNNYNHTDNKEYKGEKVLGIVSGIITVISFFGISGIALISNIENMIKFISKYYLLIPLITMIVGILNYYLVIIFIKFNRRFIRAGLDSANVKTDFKLYPAMKYVALAFLLGFWLIERDFIQLMIKSVTVLNYPIEVYLICAYGSVVVVILLTILFSYTYLFKEITWGRCIIDYSKYVLSLYITWGILSALLIILNMMVK